MDDVRCTRCKNGMNREYENPYTEILSVWSYLCPSPFLAPPLLTEKMLTIVNALHVSDSLNWFTNFKSTACTGYTTILELFNVDSVLSVSIWMYPAKAFSLPYRFFFYNILFFSKQTFSIILSLYILKDSLESIRPVYICLQLPAMPQSKLHILFHVCKL